MEKVDFEKNETERINLRTKQAWKELTQNPETAREIMRNLYEEIFQNGEITNEVKGTEKINAKDSAIFALNHPGILEQHKILFQNTHSLPYYILYFDMLCEEIWGKAIHFVLTDPQEETYRKIIQAMGYVMVPPPKKGETKMTKEEKEKLNQTIKNLLNQKEWIAIFPEGYFFGKNNVGPLQKGLAHLQNENQESPLIGVRLEGFDPPGPYAKIKTTFVLNETQNKKLRPQEFVDEVRKKIFIETLGLNSVEDRCVEPN